MLAFGTFTDVLGSEDFKKAIKDEKFLNEVWKLENHVKKSRKLFHNKKIYFPGEPEIENFKFNKKNGIKIGTNLYKKLLDNNV